MATLLELVNAVPSGSGESWGNLGTSVCGQGASISRSEDTHEPADPLTLPMRRHPVDPEMGNGGPNIS